MTPTLYEWLRQSPLTGIFLTLLVYRIALSVSRRYHGHPLANTVLVGAALLIVSLLTLGLSFDEYFRGASFIQFLLGPITVALAIPLYNNLARLKRSAFAILSSIVVGSVAGVGSAVLIAVAFDMPPQIVLSLAPRSATTPIAIGVAEAIGGIPTLAAAFVIVTGIIGAVLAKPLLTLLRMNDDVVLGVATGIAAHGIGTARVFQISETAGAFAGLAMGLTGFVTAVVAPLLVHFLLS
jgi:predicted murein hydrolase (TIGR00659 family)